MKGATYMFKDKKILVTGGTGSFGKKFIERALNETNIDKVIVYSRDEMKQWALADKFRGNPRIQFELGDVRDLQRLRSVVHEVDYVIHAAATKIVPLAEMTPTECIKTNIIGAMNLIEATIGSNVRKVVALSTDKASSPINLYGATKLVSDKLFVAANSISKPSCSYSIVRYGNVLGSRGSVIPFFLNMEPDRKIPITDKRMTRFMIDLDQGVDLVFEALNEAIGGEIFVKKIPSMNIMDIAEALLPKANYEVIGIRPGEKLHEQMIGPEDAPFTHEYEDYYKILPNIHNWASDSARINGGVRVPLDFLYTSENNPKWMTIEELRNWVTNNRNIIGVI